LTEVTNPNVNNPVRGGIVAFLNSRPREPLA
jgi:hypothetical protein